MYVQYIPFEDRDRGWPIIFPNSSPQTATSGHPGKTQNIVSGFSPTTFFSSPPLPPFWFAALSFNRTRI
jgi:hypothetical protein